MQETIIVGIDCATEAVRVGLAFATLSNEQCVVKAAKLGSDGATLAETIAGWITGHDRVLLAFDSPLGWPDPLGKALFSHRAGEPLQAHPNDLFRRATDRFVKEKIGKQSLEVGADRIARTAHAALRLLQELRQKTGLPISMAWGPDFEGIGAIEVYPAATLRVHEIPNTGYKKKDDQKQRATIIKHLAKRLEFETSTSILRANPDVLDAVVCILAGLDFLRGDAYPPENKELAERESWIWVKRKPNPVEL